MIYHVHPKRYIVGFGVLLVYFKNHKHLESPLELWSG
jgi:hypothetical protein